MTPDPTGSLRRTVYLLRARTDPKTFQGLFDAPDPAAPSEGRAESIVAPQALYLMNSPFVKEQAAAFARRIGGMGDEDAARLRTWLRGLGVPLPG